MLGGETLHSVVARRTIVLVVRGLKSVRLLDEVINARLLPILPISLLILVCLPGCGRRDRPNANCQWPHETIVSLDLSKATQQRHLSDDALAEEDLAIRYADVHIGRSAGLEEYGRTRELCMAVLFEVIGNNHGVTAEQVRESRRHRRISLDLAVILFFAVLYGFAASGMARLVWRRFPPDEGWIVGAVAIIITSAVVSTAGVLLGELWSITVENFRVGNGHLSYR